MPPWKLSLFRSFKSAKNKQHCANIKSGTLHYIYIVWYTDMVISKAQLL